MGPEPLPTSLDPIGGSVGGTPEPQSVPARCPRSSGELVSQSSGLIVSARCRAYYCPVCGPARVREWVRLLPMGEPNRFVTVTLVPEEPGHRLVYMRDLRRRLAEEYGEVEWAYSVEANPSRPDLFHAHCVVRSPYLPQHRLQEAVGGRIVHIEAIRSGTGASGYMLKAGGGCARYALKEAGGTEAAYYDHLRVNGGRPVRVSRGYLPGGVEGARRALRASWAGSEGPWQRRAG